MAQIAKMMRIYKVYLDTAEIYSWEIEHTLNDSYHIDLNTCVVEFGECERPWGGSFVYKDETVHTNLKDAKKYLFDYLVRKRNQEYAEAGQLIGELL